MPTESSLAEFYREAYRTLYSEKGIGGRSLAHAKTLISYLPPGPGTILDVGCSAGEFMELAEAAGWKVAGVEPDDAGRDRAKQFGEVYRSAEDVHGRFDVVSASHVLEHVPAPVDFLRQLATFLNPGGTILVMVPYNSYRSPHLLVMDEAHAGLLFERAGLTITFLEAFATFGHHSDIIVRAH